MDRYRSRFDGRTPADWITQAEQFERMADQFRGNPDLSDSFRKLAKDARDRAEHRSS